MQQSRFGSTVYFLSGFSTDRCFAFAWFLAGAVGGRLIAGFVVALRQLALLVIAMHGRLRMFDAGWVGLGLLFGVAHDRSPVEWTLSTQQASVPGALAMVAPLMWLVGTGMVPICVAQVQQGYRATRLIRVKRPAVARRYVLPGTAQQLAQDSLNTPPE
jgi:hypothetical protein